MAQDQPELVASEPSDRVAAHDALDAGPDLLEQQIARVMAERVVEFLEVVEVDGQQREARAARPASLDRAVQALVELASVLEAREVVGARLAIAQRRQPPQVVGCR